MIFWQLGLAVKKHQLTETFSWLNLRAAVTVAVGTDAPGPPRFPLGHVALLQALIRV